MTIISVTLKKEVGANLWTKYKNFEKPLAIFEKMHYPIVM